MLSFFSYCYYDDDNVMEVRERSKSSSSSGIKNNYRKRRLPESSSIREQLKLFPNAKHLLTDRQNQLLPFLFELSPQATFATKENCEISQRKKALVGRLK